MKKRIAVFANAWSTEFLRLVLEGIRKRAYELNIDIYFYVGYAFDVRGKLVSEGESNIYRLPELSKFDGIILLPGTFNSEEAVIELGERVKESKVPSISLEYKIDGIDYIGTENLEASYAIGKHLVEVHGAKRFIYMGGPMDNKDSKERFIGVSKALSEHGITISEDCILNGYYSYKPARNVIENWINTHSYLPDAIICANDSMAVGVCSQLSEMGIGVPEKVRVTGYDALKEGQKFMPTLTSVHRSWSKIGVFAVNNLIDKMAGKITQSDILLETRAVYKESCGCRDSSKDEDFVFAVRDLIVEDYTNSLERVLTLESVSTVCDAMVNTARPDEMSEAVYSAMSDVDKYLGDVFKLYVNESFLDYSKKEVRHNGYDDELYCICDVDSDGAKPVSKLKREDMVEVLSETPGENHFFIILPVQKLGDCYGAIVFDDCLKYIYDYSFNAIEDNIDGAVRQIRQSALLKAANVQLHALSERDSLTGIYNRVAYDRYALPLIDKLKNDNKDGVIMIVDIDKMKIINDRYGHLQGDTAIKIVADSLAEALPENWILIRYGGDEFLAIGEAYKGIDFAAVVAKVNKAIEENVKKQGNIMFTLSVSIGMNLIKPNENESLSQHFKEADASMYEMKEINHNKLNF